MENKYTEKDEEQLEITSENAMIIAKSQKLFGGVIRTAQEGVKYFEDLGYDIKYIKVSELENDEQLLKDITERNKVNYVVCYIEEIEVEVEKS